MTTQPSQMRKQPTNPADSAAASAANVKQTAIPVQPPKLSTLAKQAGTGPGSASGEFAL